MAARVEPGPPALAEPIAPAMERPQRSRSGASVSSHDETLADPQPNGDTAHKSIDHEERGQAKEENALDEKREKQEAKKEKEEKDPFLVTLEGREHLNPHSWPVWYRWWLTGFAGLLVLNASEFENPSFSQLASFSLTSIRAQSQLSHPLLRQT